MNSENGRRNVADVIGIGAQKAATSWAAHALNMHPRVWFPEAHALGGKEVRFFDVHWRYGLDWYKRIMTPPESDRLVADVSPGYARIPPARIRVCAELSPTARVFYILRNPIERDWSSLLMQAERRGYDLARASFVDLMVLYDHWRIDQFTAYVRTIHQWRQFFGERLWVGLYDDILIDPNRFFMDLADHIELDLNEVPDWRSHIQERVFPSTPLAPPPEMVTFLSRKYATMCKRLEELLDRDLAHWRAYAFR